MSALSLRRDVAITASVNLLDRARELKLDRDKIDTICYLIGRLRYVEEVEDRHQFWCKLDLQTSNPDVAARRINDTLAKIERVLLRYHKH